MRITIYLDSSIKGPTETDGWCAAVIENEDGVWSRTAFSQIRGTTQKANLMCLKGALRLINTQADEFLIYTTSQYVANGIEKLEEWNANDWKKTDGGELKYAPHWAAVYEHIRCKKIVVNTESHSYSKWMKSEMERRAKENGF